MMNVGSLSDLFLFVKYKRGTEGGGTRYLQPSWFDRSACLVCEHAWRVRCAMGIGPTERAQDISLRRGERPIFLSLSLSSVPFVGVPYSLIRSGL